MKKVKKPKTCDSCGSPIDRATELEYRGGKPHHVAGRCRFVRGGGDLLDLIQHRETPPLW